MAARHRSRCFATLQITSTRFANPSAVKSGVVVVI
jgi:hypothetical protein